MPEFLRRAYWAFDGFVDSVEAICRILLSWVSAILRGALAIALFIAVAWVGYAAIAKTGQWLSGGGDIQAYDQGYEAGIDAVCSDIYVQNRQIYDQLRGDRIC